MRVTFRILFCAIAFNVLAPGSNSHAGVDAQVLAQQICRSFQGVFRWDTSSLPQIVTMELQDVSVQPGDVVILNGTGRYVVYLDNEQVSLTNIEFEWQVDARTLNILMHESNPDTEDFITAGAYRGRISPDLSLIEARWRTNGTQDTGILQLRAAAACRSGV